MDKTGVHASHCCKRHGCKYGDGDCPVVMGKVDQEYPCEDCDNERDIMIIPADPRYPINKKPLITSEMKARFIGEFTWEEQADYYDEEGNVIEHVAIRIVPWDICKQIFKEMAEFASNKRIEE